MKVNPKGVRSNILGDRGVSSAEMNCREILVELCRY